MSLSGLHKGANVHTIISYSPFSFHVSSKPALDLDICAIDVLVYIAFLLSTPVSTPVLEWSRTLREFHSIGQWGPWVSTALVVTAPVVNRVLEWRRGERTVPPDMSGAV